MDRDLSAISAENIGLIYSVEYVYSRSCTRLYGRLHQVKHRRNKLVRNHQALGLVLVPPLYGTSVPPRILGTSHSGMD